jgi:hypothetical protein
MELSSVLRSTEYLILSYRRGAREGREADTEKGTSCQGRRLRLR